MSRPTPRKKKQKTMASEMAAIGAPGGIPDINAIDATIVNTRKQTRKVIGNMEQSGGSKKARK